MTINERVKILRKDYLDMSAERFGERLGVTRSAVTNVERGFRGVTDQLFTSICREFGVSPEWLRDGIGTPFPPKSRDQEFADLMDSALSEPDGTLKVRLLRALAKMTPED